MQDSKKVSEILNDLKCNAGDSDESSRKSEVTVGDVVAALRFRGYGPLLLIVSLLAILPTGVIPGVPTLTAALIFLVSIQMLVGRTHPWIPSYLANKRISRKQFESTCKQGEKYTKKVDWLFKPRLTRIINTWTIKLIALVCCLIALAIPPLELLPFVVFIPAATIALFGIGLSVQDGVVIIIAVVWLALGAIITNYLI